MSNSPSRSPVKKNLKKPVVQPLSKKTETTKGKAKMVTTAKRTKVTKKKAFIKRKRPTFSVPSLHWRLTAVSILGPLIIAGIFFSANKLKTLVKEIEVKKGQWVALSEREVSFKKLSLDLSLVENEIPLIEKALPNEDGVIEFLNQVERLKREAEVEISAFSFDSDQPKPDRKGNSYIELAIEVNGPLANLESFLESLLNLPILIRVKMIDIDKMAEESSKMIFKAWLYVDPNFFLE